MRGRLKKPQRQLSGMCKQECVCLHLKASNLCLPADNPTLIASVTAAVKVLDVNDNPPSLAHYLETYVCENAKAGQVNPKPLVSKPSFS